MEQRRSRSTAGADSSRIRVLPVWMVLGIALLAILTLYLLFPRQALIEQHQEQGESLSADLLDAVRRMPLPALAE